MFKVHKNKNYKPFQNKTKHGVNVIIVKVWISIAFAYFCKTNTQK